MCFICIAYDIIIIIYNLLLLNFLNYCFDINFYNFLKKRNTQFIILHIH